MRQFRVGLGVAVGIGLIAACDQDFSPTPVPRLSVVEIGNWPLTLGRSDTLIVHVEVYANGVGANSVPVEGVRVQWGSSDSSIITVVPLPPARVDTLTDSLPDSATSSLTARVTARGLGSAFISASIAGGKIGGARHDADGSLSLPMEVKERWIAVSAGDRHTCALAVDSTAYCWGLGGLLGNGSASGTLRPTPVQGLSGLKLTQISAGGEVTCAREAGGMLYCWGTNTDGEVGNGTLYVQLIPGIGGGGVAYSAVSVGRRNACGAFFLFATLATCWGQKNWQALGAFASDTVRCDPLFVGPGYLYLNVCAPAPVLTVGLGGTGSITPISLSVGGVHVCMVGNHQSDLAQDLGYLICWGTTPVGQTGVDSTDSGARARCAGSYSLLPPREANVRCVAFAQAVNRSIELYRSVSAGWDEALEAHSCAIRADSLAVCFGRNTSGQLGTTTVDATPCIWDPDSTLAITAPRDTTPCSRYPVAVDGGRKYSIIGAGMRHTCALGALDSLVYCWGDGGSGRLGDGLAGSRSTPQAIVNSEGTFRFIALSVGSNHACAIRGGDQALFCWGLGTDGQLGNGVPNGGATPVRVVEP